MGRYQTSSRQRRPHDHHLDRYRQTASNAINSGVLISSNLPTRDSVLIPTRTIAAIRPRTLASSPTAAAVGRDPDTTSPLAHPAAARMQRRGKADASMREILTGVAGSAQEAPNTGHGSLQMPSLSRGLREDRRREGPFPALRGLEREPGLRRLDRP